MKYTTEKALQEIKRRAKKIRQKRERKIVGILSACASVSFIALLVVISYFSGIQVSGIQTEYGSFILSAETGGYVLTAVLSFVLGVSITIVAKYMHDKKSRKTENCKEDE